MGGAQGSCSWGSRSSWSGAPRPSRLGCHDAPRPGHPPLVQPGVDRQPAHQSPRPIPRIQGTKLIPAGQRLRLRLPPGPHRRADRPGKRAPAATIGARDVRVVRDPANASLAHLSILLRDPLSSPAPSWPVPKGSLWEPISLGVDEDGNQVSIGLPNGTSYSAASRAGKSVALSLFIAAAALDPGVTLTLLDGKQVELAPWSQSAEDFVGPDMAGAIDVLKELCDGMDRRDGVRCLRACV